MHLSSKDSERISYFYEDSLQKYGPDDPRSVHWADRTNQRVRFEILLGIGTVKGTHVLDIGCEYTGIDIIPHFISSAQKRYPE